MTFRALCSLSLLSLGLLACAPAVADDPTATESPDTTGKVVFTVSDAAADMGAVTDVNVTVDSFRVRAEGGAWTTVDVEDETYALLDLRDAGAMALLADAELEAGTYDRLELHVSDAVVVDDEGSHDAKLPGNKLQLSGEVTVEDGETATANFDFLVDKSLHRTGQGEYIFAPVIQFEAREKAAVQIGSDNRVSVSGGKVSFNDEFGMDVYGNVDAGLHISPNANLSVNAQGHVQQTGGEALVAATIKSLDLASGTVTVNTGAGGDVTLNLKGSGATNAVSHANLQSAIGSRVNLSFDAATGTLLSVGGSDSDDSTPDPTATPENEEDEDGSEVTISGTIESVNTLSGKMTIVTESGKRKVVEVRDEAEVKLSGLVSGLLGLSSHVGERVSVTYESDTNVASSVEAEGEASVETRATFEGTIEAVGEANGTLTLASETGAELLLNVGTETAVLVNGSASTAAELAAHVGAAVEVTYNAETKIADTIDVKSSGSVGAEATATVQGSLQAVAVASATITIATQAGSHLVLEIGSATEIVVNGFVASVADLAAMVGSQITVTYNTETNVAQDIQASGNANAEAETNVSGTLQAVNALSGNVTVLTSAGVQTILNVNSQTQILVNGSSATLAELALHLSSNITATVDAQTNACSSINVG